jgi:hypothetical protein
LATEEDHQEDGATLAEEEAILEASVAETLEAEELAEIGSTSLIYNYKKGRSSDLPFFILWIGKP